jgi:hypothetical protein
MKNYTWLNNITGWLIFVLAAFTYLSTIESTASFWDCSEFIACAFKLEVGHPPGSPLFIMVARLFTLFARGNLEKVPVMVNTLSALASAFTILFLFWTISHLVKKLIARDNEPNLAEIIIILGSGIVGALAYTFSDTFWFSAVEGEVYASSSLFTAFVFWAILKWENCAGEKYSNRWLVLIAYLMGLSIGVHLLNLLAIPSIVLIFYFRKYTVTKTGLLKAIGLSLLLLGSVLYMLIPGFVKLAALFDKIFVNYWGGPFWSGVAFYLLLITGILIAGIFYTQKKGFAVINTAILIVAVMIMGYSSYAMIVIRAAANTPMNENDPENMYSFLSYLNREQYGNCPLLYGQYFNAPIKSSIETSPVYAPINGKYKTITHRIEYTYDRAYKTVFPRMYSSQDSHINAYMQWTGMKESDLYKGNTDLRGNPLHDDYGDVIFDRNQPNKAPAFINNIKFFIKYQVGYMYFRYFLWNFSGRQNDLQGNFKEEINKGNWTTGLKFLDSARLGNQNLLPETMLKNKARNSYFMLPLALGLIGLFFQFKHDKRNFWVVMSLFFFTGLAIVIYLNQDPLQPRERDYAYAGSFYAFAIWIGIAVASFYNSARENNYKHIVNYAAGGSISLVIIGLLDFISNGMFTYTWSAIFLLFLMISLLMVMKLSGRYLKNSNLLTIPALLISLPASIFMGVQNWNDHDRSGRYIARDIAADYLNSCEKNAILYTNGDNDTFPLWYAQEVEGIRTDVRVINLSYLTADWYIKQMSRKVYDSDPIKMILTENKFREGIRDIVHLYDNDNIHGSVDLKRAIDFVASDDPGTKRFSANSEPINYIPKHNFSLAVDSAIVFSNGTINKGNASTYTPKIQWEIKQGYLLKNHLMTLDFLASNNWQRPVCYAVTVSNENFLNLDKYFENHGLAYRLVPALMQDSLSNTVGINTGIMFDNMMNKFKWGGIDKKDLYLDENVMQFISNIRYNFTCLANALIREDKMDSARQVLDRCILLFPDQKVPYDYFMVGIAENYYILKDTKKAIDLTQTLLENTCQELDYLTSLEKPFSNYLLFEKQVSVHILSELVRITNENGDKTRSEFMRQKLASYSFILRKSM